MSRIKNLLKPFRVQTERLSFFEHVTMDYLNDDQIKKLRDLAFATHSFEYNLIASLSVGDKICSFIRALLQETEGYEYGNRNSHY